MNDSLPSPADLDALMTERQAATIACLSVRTLQDYRLRGGGPVYVKLGSAVRYRRRDLNAWVEKHLATSTSDASAG